MSILQEIQNEDLLVGVGAIQGALINLFQQYCAHYDLEGRDEDLAKYRLMVLGVILDNVTVDMKWGNRTELYTPEDLLARLQEFLPFLREEGMKNSPHMRN